MIYMRGQARDYDGWAELTDDDGWNWRNVLPDFRAHGAAIAASRARRISAHMAPMASGA
jgi:choline dehydrogenase-like flavoprotein